MSPTQKVLTFNACVNPKALFGFQQGGCFVVDPSWTKKELEQFIEKKLSEWEGRLPNQFDRPINLIEVHTRTPEPSGNRYSASVYRYDFKEQKLALIKNDRGYPLLNVTGYPKAT
jgi:hypothetical protein